MDELIKRINRLKEEKNAVLLAHVYQRKEVQALAHYTGDSLALSRAATGVDADVIVLCGVRFMAETAAILNPSKLVLIPDSSAGCPLADMATVKEVLAKREEYPQAAVVSYINSSAAVKAESDICCTSSNALEVVNSLSEEEVIFLPDQNLGRYVASKTDKRVILWPGFCPVHNCRIRTGELEALSKKHPQARVMVHPECKPKVISQAHFVGSTAQMSRYASESFAQEYIVGTERGVLHELRKKCPQKRFYPLSHDVICEDMKKITVEKIAHSLKNDYCELKVPKEVGIKAKRALDRMLEVQ